MGGAFRQWHVLGPPTFASLRQRKQNSSFLFYQEHNVFFTGVMTGSCMGGVHTVQTKV